MSRLVFISIALVVFATYESDAKVLKKRPAPDPEGEWKDVPESVDDLTRELESIGKWEDVPESDYGLTRELESIGKWEDVPESEYGLVRELVEVAMASEHHDVDVWRINWAKKKDVGALGTLWRVNYQLPPALPHVYTCYIEVHESLVVYRLNPRLYVIRGPDCHVRHL